MKCFLASTAFVIMVTLFLITTSFATGNNALHYFKQGNELFKRSNFDGALQSYQTIRDSFHVRSAAVYYNIANCYFRLGKPGKAIVNYKRVLKLAPHDEDTRVNLALVQGQTKDTFIKQKRIFLIRWYDAFLAAFSATQFILFTELFYILSCCALIMIYLLQRRMKIVRYILVLSLSVTVILCMLSFAKLYHAASTQEAVVISAKVEIYSGPGTNYILKFILHEGTSFLLEKESEDWYLIQLENGERGWLNKQHTELI